MKTRKAKTTNMKPSFGISPTPALTGGHRDPGPPIQRAAPAEAERKIEVAARIDVGLGNTVFIRGQGDGLNWDKGVPLRCQDASTWIWSTAHAKGRLVFKLLLNDVVWAQGDDVIVDAGKKIEIVPIF